jgi:gas vesicle protein
MSTGKVILGFLGGAAAGAILGVLYAPKSGRETREEISQKSSEYADDVKSKFNDFVDNVNKRVDEASDKFSKKAEKVKETTKKA